MEINRWQKVAILVLLLASASVYADDITSENEYLPQTTPSRKVLRVAPVVQETAVWCWAASAEMVLRKFRFPNLNPAADYQCAIVAVAGGPASSCWYDCYTCVSAIGPIENLRPVLSNYAYWSKYYIDASLPDVSSVHLYSPLGRRAIRDQIDRGRPIIAGITPSGFGLPGLPGHGVVIVGYEKTASGFFVYVNDPWPYFLSATPDPYLSAGGQMTQLGQYRIEHQAFTYYLEWTDSIKVFKVY